MSTLLDLNELAAYRGKRSESIKNDRGFSLDGQLRRRPRLRTVRERRMISLHTRRAQA